MNLHAVRRSPLRLLTCTFVLRTLTTVFYLATPAFAVAAAGSAVATLAVAGETSSAALCELAFKSPAPGSYPFFVAQSEARRGNVDRQPKFLNPTQDRDIAKTWVGEAPPAFFQQLLPPGVTLITHQLRNAAAPGVVKVEQPGGNFLMLRVSMPFNGREVATNVTLTADALWGNLARSRRGEKLWLVGPETKAAIDWGHGGGTNTTGGHTAETLMNYMAKYGVATLGMDQPFHGEGARDGFASDEEYFQFRVAFRDRFIAPDVPTFMVGHSFGGQIGDMVVRRSAGNSAEAQALRRAYVGVIPLSFVADPMPGASYMEKTRAERQATEELRWESNAHEVNPLDVELMHNLMRAGKCSPLSGLFCDWMSLYSNWTKTSAMTSNPIDLNSLPAAQDAHSSAGFRELFVQFLKKSFENATDGDPLPSLWYIGQHDFLYVGRQTVIDEYVRHMKNTILWTVTSRVGFRGDVEQVGHMIFDHFTPKRDVPEATNVMATFLRSQHPGSIEKAPGDEATLQTLFKKAVLADVDPRTYLTPVNGYSSTLVLMAYERNANFRTFLTAHIAAQAKADGKSLDAFKASYFLGYTEKNMFETYQVARDFMSAILQLRGIDLEKQSGIERNKQSQESEDPLANSRETMIGLFKTYVNNLAFREYLDHLVILETGATDALKELNLIGQNITTRLKVIEAIGREKISAEEKAQKAATLPPLIDENGVAIAGNDVATLKAVGERIQAVRVKGLVPDGPLHDFAAANVAARAEVGQAVKTLERQKTDLAKGVNALREEVGKKEGLFQRSIGKLTSPRIATLEVQREKLFAIFEDVDAQQRLTQEKYMAQALSNRQSWVEAFRSIPPDLQQLFIKTEEASANYQAILRKIEEARLIEARAGHFGDDMRALAEELYGEGGSAAKLAAMSQTLETLEYVTIEKLRRQQDELLEAYIKAVSSTYFTADWIAIRDVLANPATTDETMRVALTRLANAISLWRRNVLTSKPTSEGLGLY